MKTNSDPVLYPFPSYSPSQMIILRSEKLDDFFSEIIGNSPVSAIEFFEDLSDDYGFERTWDVPDEWIWKFNNPQDLKDLLQDYDLDLSDL